MNLDKFEKIINEAFDIKEKINANSDKSIINAIKETIELTDQGKIRVHNIKNTIKKLFNTDPFCNICCVCF